MLWLIPLAAAPGEAGSERLSGKNAGASTRVGGHPHAHHRLNAFGDDAQRIRLDRDREASHDLNRLLDEPGS